MVIRFASTQVMKDKPLFGALSWTVTRLPRDLLYFCESRINSPLDHSTDWTIATSSNNRDLDSYEKPFRIPSIDTRTATKTDVKGASRLARSRFRLPVGTRTRGHTAARLSLRATNQLERVRRVDIATFRFRVNCKRNISFV